jgi:cytochrome c oxidase assembly protein subunit 15
MIGGATVLLSLAWWSVAVHFTVSMVMVWLAVQLVAAAGDGSEPARALVPRAVRGLTATSTAVLAALLVVGTFVTAAGPHAGDAGTPRLDLPVPALAQLHADLLFAYLGMLVALGFTLHAVGAAAPLQRRYRLLVAAVVAQGALGGTQYALGVPEALVSLHVLGAALVTVGAAALWAGTTERPHGATALPSPAEMAPTRA